jgi:hypothetical protein
MSPLERANPLPLPSTPKGEHQLLQRALTRRVASRAMHAIRRAAQTQKMPAYFLARLFGAILGEASRNLSLLSIQSRGASGIFHFRSGLNAARVFMIIRARFAHLMSIWRSFVRGRK